MPREGKREKKKAFLSTWKIEQKRERGKEGGRERGRRERGRERERGEEREGGERERGREILTIKSHYVRMIKHCHSISFSQYLCLLIR